MTTANLLPGRVRKREEKKSRSKMRGDGGQPVSHKGTRPVGSGEERDKREEETEKKGEFDSPNGCGDEDGQIRGAGVGREVSTKKNDNRRKIREESDAEPFSRPWAWCNSPCCSSVPGPTPGKKRGNAKGRWDFEWPWHDAMRKTPDCDKFEGGCVRRRHHSRQKATRGRQTESGRETDACSDVRCLETLQLFLAMLLGPCIVDRMRVGQHERTVTPARRGCRLMPARKEREEGRAEKGMKEIEGFDRGAQEA